MKSGAVTFLTKPIDGVALIAGVERALDLNRTYLQGGIRALTAQRTTGVTSSGERPAEQAGCWRSRDHRNAVQMHRGIIMRKMESDSFAALVKIAGKPNL
jgi:FixJ family two-component response regulator